MKNVLVVSGHTDLNDSVANKTVMEELAQRIPSAEFDYLDKLYPDFKIDVAAEQAKLEKADVIVLAFPMFWFSMPSLLERWMEETFVRGWSHGSTGDKLKGKKLVVSITSGAMEDTYTKSGGTGHDLDDFLLPIMVTCGFCGMEYAGRVYTGNVSYATRSDAAALADMKSRSKAHAERLAKLVASL